MTFGWALWVDILFVDDKVISFCFLVFLLIVKALCCRTCWRSALDPDCLGMTHRGCRTVRVVVSFFFCYLCPRRVPARCHPELFFMRCLFEDMGVGSCLRRQSVPCSSSSAVLELHCSMQRCWAGTFKSPAVELIITSFPRCSVLGRSALFIMLLPFFIDALPHTE